MNRGKKILLALMILIMVSGLVYAGVTASAAPKTIHVEQVFVDIDGDGDLDLLVSGRVILNNPKK